LALRDAVQNTGELVVRVLADLSRTVSVFVVKSFHSTKSLDEGEIARTASRDNLAARENSELDR
jgi:hypothetical protein